RVQVAQDPAPVPRRVLPEDRPGRRLDQVGERTALAAWVPIARLHVRRHLLAEGAAVQHLEAAFHARHALLVRDAEIAEAGLVHRRPHVRPDAGVEARIHADPYAVAQVERLAAGDGDQLLLGDGVDVVQQPDRLVRADHGGARPRRDALRAPEG